MISAYSTFSGGIGEAPGAYGRGIIGNVIDPAAAPEIFDPITEPVDACASAQRIGGSPGVADWP